jgi:sulfate transport system ATP-binding protein
VSISIKNVSKSFGGFTALDNVSLEVPDGMLLALLGPSGSGKTTLLRIIAGLEVADSGTVAHHDEDITEYSARERQIGFVFQHYALFRHMTVAENIGYSLKVRGRPKAEIAERVAELLSLIRLDGYGSRFPAHLSGGQRQRVALARALAARPRVLLLDEPFGALDAKVRQELRQWLRRLHEEINVTSIFVTHDQEEAFEVADRVVVMNNAKIEQIGTPDEVYAHPATPFVYSFLGDVNLFHGRIREGRMQLGATEFNVPAPALDGQQAGDDVAAVAYVRPHEIKVQTSGTGIAAIVRHVRPAGRLLHAELERTDDGSLIHVELTREESAQLSLLPGTHVFVELKNLRIFPEEYSI